MILKNEKDSLFARESQLVTGSRTLIGILDFLAETFQTRGTDIMYSNHWWREIAPQILSGKVIQNWEHFTDKQGVVTTNMSLKKMYKGLLFLFVLKGHTRWCSGCPGSAQRTIYDDRDWAPYPLYYFSDPSRASLNWKGSEPISFKKAWNITLEKINVW